MHKRLLIFIQFLLSSFLVSANGNYKDTIARLDSSHKKFYSFRQFENETFLYIESPARWDKSDWLRTSLAVSGTALFMALDRSIYNLSIRDQRYINTIPVKVGEFYGQWYTVGSIAALYVSYGILKHNTRMKTMAVELFQGGLYSEFFTEVLKVGIGRASPKENLGSFFFHPFYKFRDNWESMPSGHSACAFAISSILSRNARSPAMKILAYVPAVFTLLVRVYEQQHWSSDEFFGSAIGFSTGNWVVNLHEGKKHKIRVD